MKTTPLSAAVLGLVVGAALMLHAAPVAAQSSSSGFGGQRSSESTKGQTFDVTMSVAEGYDDDLYGDGTISAGPTRPQVSGYSTFLSLNGAYAWKGERVQVGATGASAFRYYSGPGDFRNVSEAAGVGVSAQFAKRTNLFINQTFAYSPSYLYGLFPTVGAPGPGDVPAPAPDYETFDTESYSYGTTVSMSHGLTRRGQMSAGVSYDFTDYVHEDFFRRDLKSFGGHVDFTKMISRNTNLTVGYRFRMSDYYFTLGRQTSEHNLTFNVAYTKPLSATRRATFGFSLTPASVETPGAFASEGLLERQYRVLADGQFSYQFNRTWTAAASYSRSFEYVPGLAQPVYADGIRSVVSGMFGRHWDFNASAAISKGGSALAPNTSQFDTYTGDVQLRYVVKRNWALYGEYIYYFYDFSRSLQLPIGASPRMERNGLRFGVSLWVPVKRR